MTKVHLDALGRVSLSVAWNKSDGSDDFQKTRSELDIEGSALSTTHARGIRCAEQKFDVLGRAYWSKSTDAGQRLMVADVAGKPLRSWDNRGQTARSQYDDLQRPVKSFVKVGAVETVVTRTVFGESKVLGFFRARGASVSGRKGAVDVAAYEDATSFSDTL